MERLIDADMLIKKLYSEKVKEVIGLVGIAWAESLLNTLPTVDAVPVVHGRWIDEGAYVTAAYGSLDVYQCSNCNQEITIDDYDNYCPNCGARMDGDAK